MTPDEAIRLLRATLDALEPLGGHGYRRDGITSIVIDGDGVQVNTTPALCDWIADEEGADPDACVLTGNAAADEPLRTRRILGIVPVPVRIVAVTP